MLYFMLVNTSLYGLSRLINTENDLVYSYNVLQSTSPLTGDKLTAVSFVTAVCTVAPSVAFGRQCDARASANTAELIPTACCTS